MITTDGGLNTLHHYELVQGLPRTQASAGVQLFVTYFKECEKISDSASWQKIVLERFSMHRGSLKTLHGSRTFSGVTTSTLDSVSC